MQHSFIISLALLELVSLGTPSWGGQPATRNEVTKSKIVEEGGTGPYKAVMQEAQSLEAHTLFLPSDLSGFGPTNPLPLLVWGNGACTNSPWEHFKFLNEIASHGYLVIATGYFPEEEEPYRGPMSTPEQQIESIDWAIAQNRDPHSPLYQKVDEHAICAAGMSCGGLQTLYNCTDTRITLLMICNSGLFIDPSIAMPGMPMPGKDQLLRIHTPVLYMLGGESDIAYENGMDDFHRINHVPAIAINYPVGHGGTYRQSHGGEFSIPAIAWLDWQLKGKAEARQMLFGQPCGLQQREGWTVETNQLFQQLSTQPAAHKHCPPELLPYQNPALSPLERAVDLCARLTIEEKAKLMLDVSDSIPRLGIDQFNWWSEALHGMANMGGVTVYPEPIGMASSFNDEMVHHVFSQVSDEGRAHYNVWRRQHADQRFHSLSVWTPNVNIFRDPRWGRGQETYGEDPYLTSRMGVAVVKGLQGPDSTRYRKLYACAKHFAIHSGPEWGRHHDNVTNVSPRDLYETYLPAFKACVQEGQVREVMCAYQRWDDEPCCSNTRLLQRILRRDWGFKYMVVSDCGAISDFYTSHKSSSSPQLAATHGVLAGTDVECGYNYAYRSIPEAVAMGQLDEADVDERVIRLLEGRFELGEMDAPELVSWSSLGEADLNSREHQQTALEMAHQTIVLLQNRGDVLPLDASRIKGKVAVIGPNADDEVLMWGNYNGTPPQTSTLLEGIQRYLPRRRIVTFKGCELVNDKELVSYYDQCSIDGKTGFRATFWNNRDRSGQPVATRQHTRPINVTTYGNYAFAPGVNLTGFSGIYETVFRPRQSSPVLLDVEGCSYFEVFVNGKSTAREATWRTTDTRTIFEARAGEEYRIEIRYAQIETYNANLRVDIGLERDVDYDALIRQLDGCETVIFAGGISARLEGEEMPIDLPGFRGGDRTDIELPAVQRRFLQRLHEAGKRVILVNFSGSAIALVPETETCDAIVQAWYPGEAGGQALADILFGRVNPSAKLPLTFYRSLSQLPDYSDYSMRGRTYRYMTEQPLFPFGYGLSYTRFDIGPASCQPTLTGGATLTIPVTNTGQRAGTEVVQVYLRRTADTEGPRRSLRAYQRVELKPHETSNVIIELPRQSFECFDPTTGAMQVLPGDYELFYGNSSADADLRCIDFQLQ